MSKAPPSPYLAFSVKFDGGSSDRSVFFKRLHHVSSTDHRFRECIEEHTDVTRDTWRTELPNN